jgi:hypothetical protein
MSLNDRNVAYDLNTALEELLSLMVRDGEVGWE